MAASPFHEGAFARIANTDIKSNPYNRKRRNDYAQYDRWREWRRGWYATHTLKEGAGL